MKPSKNILLDLEKPIILSILVLLLGCKEFNKRVIIEVKDISIVYTRPSIFPDTLFGYKSNVFFRISGQVENESSKDIEVTLNDLCQKNYSFDLSLSFAGRKINFFNYPFSPNRLSNPNTFIIKQHEKKYITLESARFQFFERLNQAQLDSLLTLVRNHNIQASNSSLDIKVVNSKVKIYLIPINVFDVNSRTGVDL